MRTTVVFLVYLPKLLQPSVHPAFFNYYYYYLISSILSSELDKQASVKCYINVWDRKRILKYQIGKIKMTFLIKKNKTYKNKNEIKKTIHKFIKVLIHY